MIFEVLMGIAALDVISKWGDTRVKRGKDFLGRRYKKQSGKCFRCDGTGHVHGRTCRKCGGSGRYSHTTWYE